MLHLFSQLLKDFLVQQQVAPQERIKFAAPDRDYVTKLPVGSSVNVYLVEVYENRKLRGNEQHRPKINGQPTTVVETHYPAWIDAHYLLTTWDTAADLNDKALNEQRILAHLCELLLAGDPFSPQTVYPQPTDAELTQIEDARQTARIKALGERKSPWEVDQAGEAAANLVRESLGGRHVWPAEFHLPGLPYRVMPPEGFPKLSEFWTTMGSGSVWKPVIYLVAAIPVRLKPFIESPMVTTLSSRVGQTRNAPGQELLRDTERQWWQIGGTVFRNKLDDRGKPIQRLDPAGIAVEEPVVPVPGAKVCLEASSDGVVFLLQQEVRTTDEGRFQFQFVMPLPNQPSRFRLVFQPIRVQGDFPGRTIDLQESLLPIEQGNPNPSPYDVVMHP